MNLQMQISKEIKSLYDFYDYEMSKERIIEIVGLIMDLRSDITIEQIIRFCMNEKTGQYGILYKAPSCLMLHFREFLNDPIMQKQNGTPDYIDNNWEEKKLKAMGLR